jgi:DNA polymerase-1
MAMLPVAASMKMAGILGRKRSFEDLSVFLQGEMDVIRNRMSRLYFNSRPFNPASHPQTATLLRKLGLEGEKKTSTGAISTSKKSIEHLRFTNPAIEDLEQWRERQKCRVPFADPVVENWPDEVDGAIDQVRIHCDLKITRVTSGRFSASLLDDEPSAPLLAIPVRSHLGKKVRDCYMAADGYILGSFDLDQAEMRMMADESGDPRMIKLFRDGKIDIHTDTASKMFGIPPEKVDKMKHRYPAKRVGFGVITGIQGRGLLDQLRLVGIMDYDEHDCNRFIHEWLKIFPEVRVYMEWCRSECRRQGGVIRDRWGMPRYLPAILDETRDGKWDRLEAERQTHSHRIQGGAQGWIQNAMGWLNHQLRPYGDAVRWILQVHDELIVEALKGLEDEIAAIMVEGLTQHGGTKMKVPMKSSGSWAESWGQLKD